MTKNYYSYTEYTRYVDFKRLDFIIRSIEEHNKDQHNHQIRILDVGCATGNISFPLAALGYNVLGIDVDQESIDYARNKNKFENACFDVMSAEDLAIQGTEIYDFIVCSEVLVVLKNPEKALDSFSRLLKEDGFLIITAANTCGPYCLIFVHLWDKLIVPIFSAFSSKIKPSPYQQTFSLNKIKRLLSREGFDILELKHSDFISPFVYSKNIYFSFSKFKYFLQLSSWVNSFCSCDCKLADKLPSSLVSGWYFACSKGE